MAPGSTRTSAEVRYYLAKRAIDDRSLNRHVWDTFAAELRAMPHSRPLRLLDLGAGIGSMVERFVDWKLLEPASGESSSDSLAIEIITIDADPAAVDAAIARLPAWGTAAGFTVTGDGPRFHLRRPGLEIEIEPRTGDAFAILAQENQRQRYDVVTANAFLDLLDLTTALPIILQALRPGCLCHFSINFDGATILEPPIDPELDSQIERLYHATMDERITNGKRSGDSRTGRHLFHALRQAGVEVLEMGGSDWVVYPRSDVYRHGEAPFLHHIVDTIDAALQSSPSLDPARFHDWVVERHAQIDRAELLFIAHNIDVAGRVP